MANQPWVGIGEFSRICGNVARANGQDLEGFMESLSGKWSGDQVSTQFERWAAENPSQVGALLKHIPSSAVRTAGIKGMMQGLARSNPEVAASWRQQLGE